MDHLAQLKATLKAETEGKVFFFVPILEEVLSLLENHPRRDEIWSKAMSIVKQVTDEGEGSHYIFLKPEWFEREILRRSSK